MVDEVTEKIFIALDPEPGNTGKPKSYFFQIKIIFLLKITG